MLYLLCIVVGVILGGVIMWWIMPHGVPLTGAEKRRERITTRRQYH